MTETPPTESLAPAPAAPKAPSPIPVDVTLKFWPLACAQCGVVYLVPMALAIDRQGSSGAVHCPNGHAARLNLGSEAAPDLQLTLARFSLELTATRLELDTLRIISHRSNLPSQKVSPEKAMKMRIRMMAATARSTTRDGRLCPICQFDSTSRRALEKHIARNHQKELLGGSSAQ